MVDRYVALTIRDGKVNGYCTKPKSKENMIIYLAWYHFNPSQWDSLERDIDQKGEALVKVSDREFRIWKVSYRNNNE